MFGSRLEVKRFEKDIVKYEERPVEKGKILFYGSSTFTRCSFIYCDTHLEKGHPLLEEAVRMKDGSQAIVNHGFGTSSADDLLYYYDRMVRPYAPRALVIYTGGNDMAFGYQPEEIMNILGTMIDWFQADFPGAPVYCLSQVPQFRKVGLRDRGFHLRNELNALLEDYCAKKEGVKMIRMVDCPVYFEKPEDVGDYDKAWEEVFDTDKAHLNAFGYGRFMDFFRDYLEKEGLL